MAEPKKRLTSARSGARRSHLRAKKIILTNCPRCQSPVLSHTVCNVCGYYKGTDVLNLEKKAQAKQERRKAQEKAEILAEESKIKTKKKLASTEEK